MHSFDDENEGITFDPDTLRPTGRILRPASFLFRSREFQKRAIPLHFFLGGYLSTLYSTM